MASVRSLGFVLCAALLVAALGSSASSSATVLCKLETTACVEAEAYPAKSTFSAGLAAGTTANVVSSLGTLKCKTALLKGATTAKEAEPLGGEATAVEFGECALGETKCTVTAANLPYSASFASSKEKEMPGHGTLTLGNGGKGKPSFTSTCGAVKCTYAAAPVLEVGGEPSWASVEASKLTEGTGFLCPKEASFTATYEFTTESGHLYTANALAVATKLCEMEPVLEGGLLKCPNGQEYSGTVEASLGPGVEAVFVGPGGNSIKCNEMSLEGKFLENGAPAASGGVESLIYRTGGFDCNSTYGAKMQVAMMGLGFDKSRITFFQQAGPEGVLGFQGTNGPAKLRTVINENEVCVYRRRALSGLIVNGDEALGTATVLEVNARWLIGFFEPMECPAWFTQSGTTTLLRLERPGGFPIYIAQN